MNDAQCFALSIMLAFIAIPLWLIAYCLEQIRGKRDR
jgi:hypothetical protein